TSCVVHGIEQGRRSLERVHDLAGVDRFSGPDRSLIAHATDGRLTVAINAVEVSFKDGSLDPDGGKIGYSKKRSSGIDLLARSDVRLDNDSCDRGSEGESFGALAARGGGSMITCLLAPGGLVATLRLQPCCLSVFKAFTGADLGLEKILTALILSSSSLKGGFGFLCRADCALFSDLKLYLLGSGVRLFHLSQKLPLVDQCSRRRNKRGTLCGHAASHRRRDLHATLEAGNNAAEAFNYRPYPAHDHFVSCQPDGLLLAGTQGKDFDFLAFCWLFLWPLFL